MTRGPSAGSGLPLVKIAVTRSGVQFSASTQHFSAAAAACLACSGRPREYAAVTLQVAREHRCVVLPHNAAVQHPMVRDLRSSMPHD